MIELALGIVLLWGGAKKAVKRNMKYSSQTPFGKVQDHMRPTIRWDQGCQCDLVFATLLAELKAACWD